MFDKDRHMVRFQLGDTIAYFPLDDTESFLEKVSVVVETAKYDEGDQITMAQHIQQSLNAWERMLAAPSVEPPVRYTEKEN
jgi:hypothetical protein